MAKAENKLLNKLPKGAIIGVLMLLPCLGFLFGMMYQKNLDGGFGLYPPVPLQPITPTEEVSQAPIQSSNTCNSDTDCVLYNPQLANRSTMCCHNQNMLCTKDQNQITAVNKDFYNQQTKNLCQPHTMCPMYMMVCPQDIQESISQLHAKCIKNVCQVSHNPQPIGN